MCVCMKLAFDFVVNWREIVWWFYTHTMAASKVDSLKEHPNVDDTFVFGYKEITQVTCKFPRARDYRKTVEVLSYYGKRPVLVS